MPLIVYAFYYTQSQWVYRTPTLKEPYKTIKLRTSPEHQTYLDLSFTLHNAFFSKRRQDAHFSYICIT